MRSQKGLISGWLTCLQTTQRTDGRLGEQEFSTLEPDYVLSALRARFEAAIGFAELCRRLVPDLNDATRELVRRDCELFDLASFHVLAHSVGGVHPLQPLRRANENRGR